MTTMTVIGAKARIRELGEQAQSVVNSKSLTSAAKMKQLNEMHAQLREAQAVLGIHENAKSLMSGGSALPASIKQARAEAGLAVKGLATPGITLSAADTDAAFNVLKSGGSIRVEIKDATSSEATREQLVPEYAGLVTRPHEPTRILEHTPSTTTSSAAIEYIVHTHNDTGIGAPTLALDAAAPGGAFAAGTYFWKVTALASGGETVGSNEVTATLTANQEQALSWDAIAGADAYRIYRGTSAGGENILVSEVDDATLTFTDTGTAGTAGAIPTVDRTAGARITAAGALMPEVSLQTQKQIQQAQKIAVFTRETDEIISDFATWTSYTEVELQRLIVDAENRQMLSGDGTAEILGLLNTPGTLTRARSTADATALDTIQTAITDLRNGPEYTEPDLLVLHPITWGALRKIKNTLGDYVLGDPGQSAVSSVWGIPVLQTTQIRPGVGVLANMQVAAQAWIREGFTVSMSNSDQDNFERGLVSIRGEERLLLAVTRPLAINIITGL